MIIIFWGIKKMFYKYNNIVIITLSFSKISGANILLASSAITILKLILGSKIECNENISFIILCAVVSDRIHYTTYDLHSQSLRP